MIHTRIPCKYFPEKHICVGKKYQIRKVGEGVGVSLGRKKSSTCSLSFLSRHPLGTTCLSFYFGMTGLVKIGRDATQVNRTECRTGARHLSFEYNRKSQPDFARRTLGRGRSSGGKYAYFRETQLSLYQNFGHYSKATESFLIDSSGPCQIHSGN